MTLLVYGITLSELDKKIFYIEKQNHQTLYEINHASTIALTAKQHENAQ